MTDKDWRSVTKTIISHCSKKCGFSMPQEQASEEPLGPDVSVEADWNKLQNIENQFEDYVTSDEELATSGTDADIIDTVTQNIDDDHDDEIDVDHTDAANFEPTITNKEA
ncbi:hypothetical protein HHI36_016953 [Cryptolaemus montrouzieri]|uniref:Uncharacterized protein n=1 Tax=Cryptolaemus montrouzieri TaxID=559131 RepID=A0ABD2NL93_9CUCU